MRFNGCLYFVCIDFIEQTLVLLMELYVYLIQISLTPQCKVIIGFFNAF